MMREKNMAHESRKPQMRPLVWVVACIYSRRTREDGKEAYAGCPQCGSCRRGASAQIETLREMGRKSGYVFAAEECALDTPLLIHVFICVCATPTRYVYYTLSYPLVPWRVYRPFNVPSPSYLSGKSFCTGNNVRIYSSLGRLPGFFFFSNSASRSNGEDTQH
jgi:hypothetical protein